MPKNTAKIAIIGSGFSGISTAYNIISLLTEQQSVMIDIFDKNPYGNAYATTDPHHILNVSTNMMGMTYPNHFYEWLNSNQPYWQKTNPAFENLTILPESFMPRMLYRIYLHAMVDELKKLSANKNSVVNFIEKEILDIKEINGKYRHIVIACGLQNKRITDHRVINNLWDAINNKKLPQNGQNDNILIIGSGLTAVDMILSLKNNGLLKNNDFNGNIIVCSPKAKLPLPHLRQKLPPITILSADDYQLPLSKILFKLKKASKHCEWQQILNALRPITQDFWQKLTLSKKQQFLRHCLSFWNIHRHRIPKSSSDVIQQMLTEDKLKIIKGKVVAIKDDQWQSHVILDNGQSIAADLILNCTGFDFSGKNSIFLQSLLRQKIIKKDIIGFTLEENIKNFHLAGALLTGKLLEATAVPELRVIAANIARKIVEEI